MLTTTESVLFELLQTKDNPSFKALSKLIKETKPTDADGKPLPDHLLPSV